MGNHGGNLFENENEDEDEDEGGVTPHGWGRRFIDTSRRNHSPKCMSCFAWPVLTTG